MTAFSEGTQYITASTSYHVYIGCADLTLTLFSREEFSSLKTAAEILLHLLCFSMYLTEIQACSMEVKPHGRSKKNPRPSFTTASGTRIKMSQQASSSGGPSSIYDQLYQEAGDVLSRKASADVSRSIDQVKYEPKKLRNQHEKD